MCEMAWHQAVYYRIHNDTFICVRGIDKAAFVEGMKKSAHERAPTSN